MLDLLWVEFVRSKKEKKKSLVGILPFEGAGLVQ